MDRRQFLAALFAAPLAALVALGLRKPAPQLPASVDFADADLTLSLDTFATRYIEPAADALGVSIRMVSRYDASQDRMLTQMDALFGHGVIPTEWPVYTSECDDDDMLEDDEEMEPGDVFTIPGAYAVNPLASEVTA